MNLHFQALEARIKRRKRFLNALITASSWASLSLGLSLGYLSAVALGLLSALLPLWALSLANVAIAMAGWLRGRLRRIDLATVLFHVDRTLRTGEALCTYREFSGQRARMPFSRQLEQRVEAIEIHQATALPLTRSQRRRLWTVAGLALACIWFASLGPLNLISLNLPGWTIRRATSEQTSAVLSQTEASQPLGSRELQQINSEAQQLQKQLRIAASPTDARAAATGLQELYQKLKEAQQDLWKLPNAPSDLASPSAGPSSESGETGPSAEQSDQQARQLTEARQAAQSLKEALDQLKQTLDQLQNQGQSNAPSPEAIQKELEQLAQQTTNEAIRQDLARAAQAGTPRAQRELIDRAQQQLEQMLKADQQLTQAQQQISQALREGGQRPSRPSQDSLAKAAGTGEGQSNGSNPQNQSAMEGTGQNKTDNQPASAPNQGKETAGQAGPEASKTGTGQNQGGNQTAGDQPGTTEGPHPEEQPSDQTLPPQHQLVLSPDRLPPAVNMQVLTRTKGMPFETVGSSASGDLTLQYDFAKAEALLRERGLPPALRELIRQYFLAITAEPSQP